MKVLSVRCRAFSGEGARRHRVSVDRLGLVRVYDDVAMHFTILHSLSLATMRRIRRMADSVAARVEVSQ